jgi:hypothetical protein
MKHQISATEKTRLQKYLKLTPELKKKYIIENMGKESVNRTFFRSLGFVMKPSKYADMYNVYKENKQLGIKDELIGLKSLDDMLEYIISINLHPDICFSEYQPDGFKFVERNDVIKFHNKAGLEIRNDVKLQTK